MVSPIKERSLFTCILVGLITFFIYPIVFWTKLSKDVNTLCEGDGKKTMKYVFIWLLNFITFGIAGFVWKIKLIGRLQANAARYNLRFSEGTGMGFALSLLLGPLLPQIVIVKNFNKLAIAYNEYNGLVDENTDDAFADKEEATA